MVNYVDESQPYIPYFMRTKEEKEDFVFFMWQLLTKKLRGSVYLIQALAFLHKSIYINGTSKRIQLTEIKEETLAPKWYIIMPGTLLRNLWSATI